MKSPARKPKQNQSAPSNNFTAGVGDEDDVVDIEQLIAGTKIPPKTDAIETLNEQRRLDLAARREADRPPAGMERIIDPTTFETHFRPIEPIEEFPAEEGPTIGEVVTDQAHALAEEPYMAGFAMSDEPLPIPDDLPAAGAQQTTTAGSEPQALDPRFPPIANPAPGAIDPGDDDLISPREQRLQTGIRYEGRIRILEAFHYAGRLDAAPSWVDRNWIGYADFDDLRQIKAGPCLRVPLHSGNLAVARVGDYIVQQEVVLGPGLPSDVRVEVWAKGDFEKNFLPVP